MFVRVWVFVLPWDAIQRRRADAPATARAATLFRQLDAFELGVCLRANRACRLHPIERFFGAVSRLGDGSLWYLNKGVLLSVSIMSLLLIYRHAENIGRLVKGTESRLGKKSHP